MKNITLLGIIMLVLAVALFYLTSKNFTLSQIQLPHIIGVIAGVGLGLIIGGMVGYISKGTAIKEAQKKKDLKQLQKEKADLEKQAAELANQQVNPTSISQESTTTTN